MSDFSEELNKLLADKRIFTKESIRSLPMEDQVALGDFALQIVKSWQQDGPMNDRATVALWVHGFVIGHNWVKEHWAIW